jgi:hypothetical protein
MPEEGAEMRDSQVSTMMPPFLTRRAIIKRLGVVAGSAMVPTVLFSVPARPSGRPDVLTMPLLGPEESRPALLLGLISWVEAYYAIPESLLAAMAFVESGRSVPSLPRNPWPWTLNIGGQGQFYETKASAQANLLKNASDEPLIDVGLLQINTKWHASNFNALSDMLDPTANILYAGHYLASLAYKHGSWTKGVASYHASRPEARQRYLCVVLEEWLRRSGGRSDLLGYCRP